MLRLRCVPLVAKKVLASATSEARMREVNVVVIIFSAHPVNFLREEGTNFAFNLEQYLVVLYLL